MPTEGFNSNKFNTDYGPIGLSKKDLKEFRIKIYQSLSVPLHFIEDEYFTYEKFLDQEEAKEETKEIQKIKPRILGDF